MIFFFLHNSMKMSKLNNCDFFGHILPAPCPLLWDSMYESLYSNVLPSFVPSALGWGLPISCWWHLPSCIGGALKKQAFAWTGKGCCSVIQQQRNHKSPASSPLLQSDCLQLGSSNRSRLPPQYSPN